MKNSLWNSTDDYLHQMLIVTAYYYQGGGIQNSLRFDKQMKAAVSLLNNPTKYKNVLQPSSVDTTNKPAGFKKRDPRNAFVVR